MNDETSYEGKAISKEYRISEGHAIVLCTQYVTVKMAVPQPFVTEWW